MNNSLLNDAMQILSKGGGAPLEEDRALISKCCAAVTEGNYTEISKEDFELALDRLAASYRDQQIALGRPITEACAYEAVLRTDTGKRLYTGMDNLHSYGSAGPPWE